jgi:membrane associated rhomboid family serine protease
VTALAWRCQKARGHATRGYHEVKMVFPIGDENYGRRSAPIINYTLIAINIAVFIIELVQGDRFILQYSAVPYMITHGGQVPPPKIIDHQIIRDLPGPSPIYITLFTSMFMHAGWLHIGGNMLYLWIFGDNVEDDFGHIKYLIFYLLCGLAAAFAQIAIAPDSPIPSLGASGAIAGVLGAYMIMFPRNRVRTVVFLGFFFTITMLPAILVIGLWIVMQLFSQFASISEGAAQTGGGVAYMAHIGGFFAGLILTLFFRQKRERYQPYNRY